MPSSAQRRTSASPAAVRPGPVSGEEGKANGTPCANAFGRLHTGPSERSPAACQRSSALEAGVDRLGALEVGDRGEHAGTRAASRSPGARAIRDVARTLERDQAAERAGHVAAASSCEIGAASSAS